jgi:sulfofructose kinase
LGGIVHYWGRVGDDALGEGIVALLQAEGVQTAVVRRIAGAPSPCTAVLVDDRGERRYANGLRARAALKR